jgi:predicted TPR repeat methyltransferase
MLALAEKRGVYRTTWQTELDEPYPFEVGTYEAITAIGVIGSGAAPASVLAQALAALGTGGLMVFSFNDHTLESARYLEALEKALSQGCELAFREYGPHLEAQNVGSDVIILRKY